MYLRHDAPAHQEPEGVPGEVAAHPDVGAQALALLLPLGVQEDAHGAAPPAVRVPQGRHGPPAPLPESHLGRRYVSCSF